MKRDMKRWIEDTLNLKRKKALPILSFPAIQKMGITVKQLIASSDLQAQAMKLVADLTPEGAASVSMMDLSLEAEAFGSRPMFSDSEVPTIVGAIVTSQEEADALQVPDIGAGRTQIYVDAIQKAAELITDRPVFAGVIGPFSLAGRLMGVSDALVYCLDEPEMVETVLNKAVDFQIKYINAYKAVGANGVLMAEPLAGILSPAMEEEFSCEYVKQIVEATQTDDFIVAYHNCGNCTVRQISSIITNGCRVFHFGNAIEMADMLPKVPPNMIVMGNVDPAGQFKNGTPESIRSATLSLMETCGKYPCFVPSSGCDIPPMSNWDNIDAFYAAIREYYGEA